MADPRATSPAISGTASRRAVLAAGGAALTALTLGLSACAQEDALAKQAKAGDNKNYVAGDGSVTEFTAADRKAAVAINGTLFNGTQVAPADFQGKVTVLNFWFAACAPCRVEAPILEELHQDFKDQGVQFFGVNLRDEKATAEAFDKTFNLTYPSFDDKNGGVLLAVSGLVPPGQSPPPWSWTSRAVWPRACWAKSRGAPSKPSSPPPWQSSGGPGP
ncbi:thiol-disulfide oxidoreductase ResA [Arthrobacter sp. Hiyo4]|nr:thiol-disulfide oxidoreductase ResA [Arthrobacter sp. Hiyo4]